MRKLRPVHAKTQKKLCWTTTYGEVIVQEQVWRLRTTIVRPFCEQAQVANQGCSRRLERAMTSFGAEHSFAQAAKEVNEHYGVEVGHERVRRTTLKHAKLLSSITPKPYTLIKSVGADFILAEADGTMLPVVSTSQAPEGADRRKHRKVCYREAKVVASQEVGKIKIYYDATLGSVQETGARWSQVAASSNWGVNTYIHVVADGAPWIMLQSEASLGKNVHKLLDLYHVCDYFALVWPEDKPSQHKHRDWLKAGKIELVLESLRALAEPPQVPDEKAPVRVTLRYLENRREQLDYKSAIDLKLPIGSGLIESAHRHVLQKRLKLAGAWWSEENLQAMLQLRVCRANDKWEQAWAA